MSNKPFNVLIDTAEIADLMSQMSPEEKKQALQDAGTFMISSTYVGYLSQKSPDGKPWAPNPSWYKEAKGGAATLTGPTSKTMRGGPLAGRYEFKKINTKRMRNSLMVRVIGAERAYVEYEQDAKKRASLTQHGGESKMILKSTATGKDVKFNINIKARPHLGVATYERVGASTDDQHIALIFGNMVDSHIK